MDASQRSLVTGIWSRQVSKRDINTCRLRLDKTNRLAIIVGKIDTDEKLKSTN